MDWEGEGEMNQLAEYLRGFTKKKDHVVTLLGWDRQWHRLRFCMGWCAVDASEFWFVALRWQTKGEPLSQPLDLERKDLMVKILKRKGLWVFKWISHWWNSEEWLCNFPSKFICSRIKKRRKPRVKIVTLKLLSLEKREKPISKSFFSFLQKPVAWTEDQ